MSEGGTRDCRYCDVSCRTCYGPTAQNCDTCATGNVETGSLFANLWSSKQTVPVYSTDEIFKNMSEFVICKILLCVHV